MAISLNDEKTVGTIFSSITDDPPEGFLLCDGSQINRITYANLFSVAPNVSSTITMTIANPCVVTWTAHPLATGHSIQFSTTGTLPTGIAGTVYYVRVVDVNTFHLYDTLVNSMNTVATTGRIISSGSQNGTHNALVYKWGNGDGSTTFNIPDGRGVVLRGKGTSFAFLRNAIVEMGEKTEDAFYSHNHGGGNHRHALFDGGGGSGDSEDSTDTEPKVANSWYTQYSGTIISTQGDSVETKVKSIGVNYFIKY